MTMGCLLGERAMLLVPLTVLDHFMVVEALIEVLRIYCSLLTMVFSFTLVNLHYHYLPHFPAILLMRRD